jgi:hypothetical protein
MSEKKTRTSLPASASPWLPEGETPTKEGYYWRWIPGAEAGFLFWYPPSDTSAYWGPEYLWSREPITPPPPPVDADTRANPTESLLDAIRSMRAAGGDGWDGIDVDRVIDELRG